MGAFSTCSRVLLIIVNIFFLILGLILFAVGLSLRVGDSVINVDSVKANLETSASASGFVNVDYSSFNISDALLGLALGLIFVGLFLLIVAFLGCCGSCYKIKCLLIVYVITCIVILTGQIVTIGVLYGSPDTIHDQAKDKLKTSITSDYMGLNGTNVISLGWNIVMQQVQCCGVDSYTDFTGATGWTINYSGHTLLTPLACCETLPTSSDFTCSSAPTNSNNYLNTGCYDEIWDMTLGNKTIVAVVLGGIGIFQLLLIVSGIVLLKGMKNNKTNPAKLQRDAPRDYERQPPANRHVQHVQW